MFASLLKQLVTLALTMAIVTSTTDKMFLNRHTERLLSMQFNQTQEYESGPLNFPRQQFKFGGLWTSTIRLNTIGNMSFWRDDVWLIDNNFYVTSMVVHFLWELRSLGVQTDHDTKMDNAVAKAMPALHTFQDRNHSPDDLIVSFWLQHLMNTTASGEIVYCTTSANIDNILTEVSHSPKEVEAIKLILIDLGYEDLWNVIAPYFNPDINWQDVFGLVADADDSSVALTLTTMLLEAPYFEDATKLWFGRSFTKNITSYATNAVKYAYRPFSDDFNVNIIDQRSYYWLRHYLYAVDADARANDLQANVALVVTWQATTSSIVENLRNGYCHTVPLNVNNVDASVSANAILAMTRSLFTFNSSDWFTPDVQQVYWNTTTMLLFTVEHHWVQTRPDIVLLYYPAASDFYWYLARILAEYRKIEKHYKHIFTDFPFIFDLYQSVETVMTSIVTPTILADAQQDSQNGYYFWQEFIGLNDTNQMNEPSPHYYDRMFQTAMFSNALLYVWSAPEDGTLQWRTDTPLSVKQALQGSIHFLRNESFNVLEYRPENAFFSGSYKVTPQTDKRVYPANYNVLPNGTVLDPQDCDDPNSYRAVMGVQGMIDDEMYQKLMQAKPCHMIKTPTDFGGFNQYSRAWPFWSSHAITHAATMLAVARYDRIGDKII